MAANVLIVGCGRLGALVATALVDRGDSVTIIDTDAENFRRLAEQRTVGEDELDQTEGSQGGR